MVRDIFSRWRRAPLLTGWMAALCATLAVAVPTLIRVAVNGVVTGCEFTPYLPFVFLCAMTLRWWKAGSVALACVVIMGGFLERSPNQVLEFSCFVPSAGIFLAASAGMIAAGVFIRHVIAAPREDDSGSGGVIFSLEQGEVWASWYGQGHPVRLGIRSRVSNMMEDFLKQEQLAKRLAAKAEPDSEA